MKSFWISVVAVSVATVLTAMPTEKETRKAESVVKKLMASQQAALRSGKKTRAEVAAAAVKLVGEADTEAVKLLLMKGAFSLYVKDGNLEKAAETMAALEATISDVPPKSVTNMVETAFRGQPRKAKIRLCQLLDEVKSEAAKRSAQSVARAKPRLNGVGKSVTRAKSQVTDKYPNLRTNVVDGVSWLYVEAGKRVSLVGAASSLPQNLVIPSEIDGKKVMMIEEKAFEGCEEIVTLETPDSAMSIGKNAFAGCPNLESVRIMSGSIRWSVFRGCPKLESVFVGEKVQSLEYGSLAGCERLASVIIEEGPVRLRLQDPFEGDGALTSLHLPARYDGTESWCHGAFGDCSGLTKLTITEGNRYCRAENGLVLSADGKTLLAVASGLSSFDIPDSVETIPYRAIKGCNQIRELVIPDSVKTICAQSIGECSNLETLTFGTGVESIQSPNKGNSIFYQCPRSSASHMRKTAQV